MTSAFAAADQPPAYFGGETGVVCMGDSLGRCSDVIPSTGHPLAALLYMNEKDLLVVISKASMLATYKLAENKPVGLVKMKLAVGPKGLLDVSWCGVGQLAVVSDDMFVRVQDLPRRGRLAPAADVGRARHGGEQREARLAVVPAEPPPAREARDDARGPRRLEAHGRRAARRPREGVAAAAVGRAGRALAEVMAWSLRRRASSRCAASAASRCCPRRSCGARWWATGRSPASAHLITLEHKDGACVRLETDAHLAGCDVHGDKLLAWTSREVFVYQYDDSPHNTLASPPVLLSSFERDARCVCAAIFGESLFLSAAGRIEVTNFEGYVTATLPFADSEGSPSVMHVAGQGKYSYLVAGTERGVFKAWEVSRKEPRQHVAARRVAEAAAAGGGSGAAGGGGGAPARISNVAISADGSRIACTVESQPAAPAGAKPGVGVGGAAKAASPAPWRPDGKLHVYLVDADAHASHDFLSESGRIPTSFFWEDADPKLIGVETRPAPAPPPAAPRRRAPPPRARPRRPRPRPPRRPRRSRRPRRCRSRWRRSSARPRASCGCRTPSPPITRPSTACSRRASPTFTSWASPSTRRRRST